jgi:hypothetical protein
MSGIQYTLSIEEFYKKGKIMKEANKFAGTYLVLFLLCFLATYVPVHGKVKEKAIIFNATTGHNHDGANKGALTDGLGQPNGIATLNSSAKLTDSQLPALAQVSVYSAANEIEQLGFTAEEGDVCIRTDESKTYFHNGGIAGDMTDWTESIATTPPHADTTGKTVDDHHAQSHAHDGVDSSGTVDSADVIYDNSGASLSATDVEAALDELSDEKIDSTEKGAANGVATLDSGSKVPSAQIPAVALTDTYTCGNESCQTSLSAEEGDVCIRSDETKSYVHNGGTADDMTDWWELEAVGLVNSVNGDTGVVTGMEETADRQTTISDSDTNYPTSGAVVDYHAANLAAAAAHTDTTGKTVDDHHDDMSDTYDITPATVTTTGDIKINSDATDDQILFGTASDVTLYRGGASELKTAGSFTAVNVIKSNTRVEARDIGEGDTAILGQVLGDGSASIALTVQPNSGVLFGSGSASLDVNLYRAEANILKTDDNLYVALGLRVEALGAGDIQTDADGDFYVSSDARLKEIQSSFTKGLKELAGIKPVNFKFNEKSGLDTKGIYTGFIAQNVREAGIKEATSVGPRGFYTFSDRPVLAAAINAINELNEKIIALEGRIKTLEE